MLDVYLNHGYKHKRFNSHAIKQRLHGSWNTIHPRHDMHTQQRSVHVHHQQESVAYPHAELQTFSRMLRRSVHCTITFAKQQDNELVDDTYPVRLYALSDIGLMRICFHIEPKLNIKVSRSYWDRLQVQQAFGKHINKHILYVHAIYFCETHI